MQGRLVILSFFITFFITSCSKQEIREKEKTVPEQFIVKSKSSEDIYVSGWQPALSWSTVETSNNIAFQNNFPIAPSASSLKEGVVLVFARKLWEDDPLFKEMGAEDKPLQMPFYFLPYFEEPGYAERWDYKIENEKIAVMLTVEGTKVPKAPKKKIELQFVIIPNEVLNQRQQTETAVKRMSYEEVLQTFDIKS